MHFKQKYTFEKNLPCLIVQHCTPPRQFVPKVLAFILGSQSGLESSNFLPWRSVTASESSDVDENRSVYMWTIQARLMTTVGKNVDQIAQGFDHQIVCLVGISTTAQDGPRI